ncbi:spirocyclase AveC family protein [Streptomyces sp. NPDC059896]|uniref:spirocyclase AveC family protein n=1 Tax=Streptomyces sp. NPDC059896 TaxID=3346993 RepID=UPI00365672C8
MNTDKSTSSTPAGSDSNSAGGSRWKTPVMAWAILGLLFLVVQAFIFGHWLMESDISPAPYVGHEIATSRRVYSWVHQAVMSVAFLGIAAYFLHHCRKNRKVTFMAAVYVGWIFTFWQDPIAYYRTKVAILNHSFINVSTWGPSIPGFHGPDPQSQIQEVVGSTGFGYGITIFAILGVRAILDLVCNPRRQWKLHTLIPAAFILCVIACIAVEMYYIRGAHAWAWIATYPGPTLFEGHWYQMSVLGDVLYGLAMLPMVVMDRIARDRGTEVAALRGTDRLPTRAQPWSRILAGIGLVNACFLLYIIPIAFLAQSGSPVPGTPVELW